MKRFFAELLRRACDFVYGERQERSAENIEEQSERIGVSWMTREDAYAAGVDVGANQCLLNGVIHPLAHADKENPERQQKCVCVCHAADLHGQRPEDTGYAERYEYLIPVLKLKRGWKFTHLLTVPDGAAAGERREVA
jgi:hypothetical protein